VYVCVFESACENVSMSVGGGGGRREGGEGKMCVLPCMQVSWYECVVVKGSARRSRCVCAGGWVGRCVCVCVQMSV